MEVLGLRARVRMQGGENQDGAKGRCGSTVVNATDVHILIDHFYGPDGVAESQELLRLQPEPTLAEAAFQKGICVGEQDVELLSVLFAETSRLTTELAADCQTACKRDPGSAFNRDPSRHWFRLVPVANRRAPRGAE